MSLTTTDTNASDYVTFISVICGKLKDIKRTGWVRSGIPFPESDADHMHRCAMCAMILFQEFDDDDDHDYHPSKVDKNKLLKMALTHDLCESLVGDITPHCNIELLKTKEAKEQAAMEEIRKAVGDPLGKELYDLWREYEDQESVEAIYCKDIDKFEMVVQAFEYEEKHLQRNKEAVDHETVFVDISAETIARQIAGGALQEPLRGFFTSTNASIKTPLFRRMDREVRGRRESLLKGRGWDVMDDERQLPQEADSDTSMNATEGDKE
jgi:putative hydrolase of HD superfamily